MSITFEAQCTNPCCIFYCTTPQAAIIKTDSEFTAYRSAIIYTPFSSITLLPLIQHIQIVLKSDAVRTELHHFYYLRLIKSITLDLYILHLLPIFTPSISLLCKYFSKEFFPIFRSSWHSLNVNRSGSLLNTTFSTPFKKIGLIGLLWFISLLFGLHTILFGKCIFSNIYYLSE